MAEHNTPSQQHPRQVRAADLRVGDVIIEEADGHTAIDTVIAVTTDTAPAGNMWVHVRADRVSIYRERLPAGTDRVGEHGAEVTVPYVERVDVRRNSAFIWPAMGPDVLLTVLRA